MKQRNSLGLQGGRVVPRLITAEVAEADALRRGEEIKARVYALLHLPAVLAPYYPRTNVPVFAAHQAATIEAMDDPGYLTARNRDAVFQIAPQLTGIDPETATTSSRPRSKSHKP